MVDKFVQAAPCDSMSQAEVYSTSSHVRVDRSSELLPVSQIELLLVLLGSLWASGGIAVFCIMFAGACQVGLLQCFPLHITLRAANTEELA